MRTTIRLPDDLLVEVKQYALKTGRTLTQVIEDALREVLLRRQAARHEPVHLTTVGGHGTLPGVDIDNNAALLEIMEQDDRPR